RRGQPPPLHDALRSCLSAPLLFVPDTWVKAQREGGEPPREIGETASAAYAVGQRNVLDARGQQVSFAPPVAHGDTRLEVNTLTWAGHTDTTALTSRPFLQSSNAVVPSLRHIAGQAPGVDLEFAQAYLARSEEHTSELQSRE